jgi:glutamyl-tRNA synthetase
MSFDPNGIGDFIIVRSDGMAAYNFACVIDDHFMRVSHVIRGDDHLSNTPRQMLIYKALDWKPPGFAHHPLILGPDRSPLSKRHGATAVSQYREEGFLPEALLNYLVLLGWTPPSEKGSFSRKDRRGVSLHAVSSNAPVHSCKKLEWLNSVYIRNRDEEELCKLLLPISRNPLPAKSPHSLIEIVRVLGESGGPIRGPGMPGIFFGDKFSMQRRAKTILSDPLHREILQAVLNLLEALPEMTSDAWPSLLTQLEEKTGGKKKDLYSSLRAAITGKTRGPELAKTLPLLGRERIIQRLKMALATTNNEK